MKIHVGKLPGVSFAFEPFWIGCNIIIPVYIPCQAKFFDQSSKEGHTRLNRTIRALVAALGQAPGALDRSDVNLMNIQEDHTAHRTTRW